MRLVTQMSLLGAFYFVLLVGDDVLFVLGFVDCDPDFR